MPLKGRNSLDERNLSSAELAAQRLASPAKAGLADKS
jgi:hypothetical protein